VTPSKRVISASKASMNSRMMRAFKPTLASTTSSTWSSSTRNLSRTRIPPCVTGLPPWKPKLRQKHRLFRPWPLFKCAPHSSKSRRFKSQERKIWIVRQTPACLYLRKRKGNSSAPSTRSARHQLLKSNRLNQSSPHSRWRPPSIPLFRVVATRWLQYHRHRAWCATNNLKIKSA